jgi:hypothetical protein
VIRRKPLSIEQSEELIAQLKTETPSEFEQLRKTLQLLGQVPELSQGMMPPILPSQINASVVNITTRRLNSPRTVITAFITAGVLVSATLTAAAVTGRGPAPLVSAAHHTAKFVRDVVGTVATVVTGGNSKKAPDTKLPSDQPNLPVVSSTPSPEKSTDNNSDSKNGNSEPSNKSTEGGNSEPSNKSTEGGNSEPSNKSTEGGNSKTTVPPIAGQEGNSSDGNSGETGSKVNKTPIATPTGENSKDEHKSNGERPSQTPTPEPTPTQTGDIVLQQDMPTPTPGIAQPSIGSEIEGTD